MDDDSVGCVVAVTIEIVSVGTECNHQISKSLRHVTFGDVESANLLHEKIADLLVMSHLSDDLI